MNFDNSADPKGTNSSIQFNPGGLVNSNGILVVECHTLIVLYPSGLVIYKMKLWLLLS
jgi:hypothetical protein